MDFETIQKLLSLNISSLKQFPEDWGVHTLQELMLL